MWLLEINMTFDDKNQMLAAHVAAVCGKFGLGYKACGASATHCSDVSTGQSEHDSL